MKLVEIYSQKCATARWQWSENGDPNRSLKLHLEWNEQNCLLAFSGSLFFYYSQQPTGAFIDSSSPARNWHHSIHRKIISYSSHCKEARKDCRWLNHPVRKVWYSNKFNENETSHLYTPRSVELFAYPYFYEMEVAIAAENWVPNGKVKVNILIEVRRLGFIAYISGNGCLSNQRTPPCCHWWSFWLLPPPPILDYPASSARLLHSNWISNFHGDVTHILENPN